MKEINIRLNANRAKAVHTGIKIASGDKGIVFKIVIDELNTEGTTAKIVFKRSNGTSVEAGIEAEEGVYSYTTLGNEFAVVGQVVADVKLYKDDARISTCTFVFDVTSDTLDGLGAGTGGYSDTLERMKKTMEEIMAQMRETMDGAEEDIEEAEKKMSDLTADLEALYQEYVDAFGNTGPFNPRGPYSETETYTVRDLVTHDDASWVCYRNCTGATPSKESDCWQHLAVGAEVDLDDIIDGTTQVGDAKKLDGHGVDFFASSEVLNNVGILEKALTLEIGAYTYHFGTNAVVSDLPNANYKWGSASVFVRYKASAVYVILWGIKTTALNCPPTFNYYDGAGWSGWNTLFTTDGGTVSGIMTVASSTNNNPLVLNYSGDATSVIMRFIHKDVTYGYLGFDENGAVVVKDGKWNTILHTGNKPSGTYTGNGDATIRTIATGGIGNVCVVYSGGYMAIVSEGAIISDGSAVTALPITQCSFSNGNLVLATTNPALNPSNGVRGYIVL